MEKSKDPFYKIMHRAYIWDGKVLHTDEAMMLACLVHSKGHGRDSNDMTDLQKIMRDVNIASKENK